MNKLLLGGASAAAILVIAPAIAQPAPPPPAGVAQGTAPAPIPQIHQFRMERLSKGPETRDQMVGHVREMFGKLDTNHDGFVTREEADAVHQAMAGDMREHFAKRLAERDLPKPDRGAMFDRLDTNHDGSISRQEFVSAKPEVTERRIVMIHEGADGAPGEPGKMRMHGMGMGMHGRMFETADANHDGRVSLQEMTAAALQRFDMADANHDGTLSPEERMQMHQRMKGQRMQPA
jgi:Ca2+-binding EF-hand superfamily protein